MNQVMSSSSVPRISTSESISVASQSRSQQSGVVLEELSSDDDLWEEDPDTENEMPTQTSVTPSIPDLFTLLPPLRDSLETRTSILQAETIQEILPYLAAQSGEFEAYNYHGLPRLDRARHIRFLHQTLKKLPPQYVSADAARPWFFYWALCGLQTMGEDVRSYRERLISTVQPMQNATGGFGSGHGQMSHLAPTYAILLSLAMVGGEAVEVVDRMAMWRWLGALKQADGGFQMSIGGEEDVRGTYCAAIIISLLDLPVEFPPGSTAKLYQTDNLLTRVPEYVGRCQTYEGGIASRPDGEAHGAYTFCALACLCILDDPQIIMPQYLDISSLFSWLSSRQHAPEGGFAGRTNKLVDGCYSHWIGACFPLLAAALRGPSPASASPRGTTSLSHREGLIRYIHCACQDTSRRGGLRDKPSKNSDGYHTCYVLAGLSSAQHAGLWSYKTIPSSLPSSSPALPQLLDGVLSAPYRWRLDPWCPSARDKTDEGRGEEERKRREGAGEGEGEIFDRTDWLGPLHPVFVVPDGVAERTRGIFINADIAAS